MKTIILLLLCIPFTANGFLVNEYKGIPVEHNRYGCGEWNEHFNMCYHWNENKITVQEYNLERNYFFDLSHEYAHPLYRNTLTQAQRDIWEDVSTGKYDTWLESHWVDTSIEYFSDYAKKDIEEDFSETYGATQHYTFPSVKTKLWFKMRLVEYFTN